jgi:glycosyltransferase involved in cell wall biosynthesis
LKILQLIQKPQLRGAEVFSCQLSTCLNAMGHESIIVPVFPGNVSLPFDGRVLPLNANPSRRMFDLDGWKQLARLITQEQPDVIQANAGDTLKYAACSRMIFGWKQPIVFRNASTISLYIKTPPAKFLNGLFLKQVSHVASVSSISKADFLTLYPSFKNRIETLPIGINAISLPEKTGNKAPVIIHVGGFTYEKNHKGLIRIFQQLLTSQPHAVLWLVGDGPLRSEIEKMVADLGLKDKVIFYGFRGDAMLLLRQADVMLLPSIIEGLPGVILEAFYCKTPVVAYDVGGVKEVLSDSTGRLVAGNDEEAFAHAVLDTLRERPDNKINAAYRLATEQYTNDSIAGRFLKLYQSII